ncbi:hypothetical protein N9948_00190 [bacterium]|nr:hypothetical protein [bacterium]
MSKTNLKDFSPESMKKAVTEAALTHPVFLVCFGLGFFGTLGVILFSAPMLAIGASIIGTIGALGTFGVNFFGRRASLESEYIKKLNRLAEERTKNKLSELKSDIDYCLDFSDNDKLVVQANKQFDMVNNKFDSFKEILNKKFDPNELTYGRFYTTAEQTHGAVLDNIEKVVLGFKALKDIDLDYLEEKYDELKKIIDDKTAEKFDKEEFEAIQGRIDLREKKFYEIDEVLSKNEMAMTELNNITCKLSEIKTHEGRSKQDLEKTLSDLTNLADSARKYEV